MGDDMTLMPPEKRMFSSRSAPALKAHSRLTPMPERNHLLFPPHGPNRPVLRQVLQEPWVGEFLGRSRARDLVDPCSREAKEIALAEQSDYRRGLGDLFAQLEAQEITRKREERRQVETLKFEEKMLAEQERTANFSDKAAARPGWQIARPQIYFNDHLIDESAPNGGVKIENMQGIYGEKCTKPPHHEFNAGGGWNPSRTNEDNAENALFGNKVSTGPVRPRKNGPTEEKFAVRLTQKIAAMQKLIKEDELNRTDGARRRKLLAENAGEFSSLNRRKKDSKDPASPKNGIFSDPDPDPPGSKDAGLAPFIEQPERTMSYARDFIAGSAERKSFWAGAKPGAVTGSASQADRAKFLLCPPGCRKALLGTTSCPGLDPVPSGGFLKKGTVGGTPCRNAMPQSSAGAWPKMDTGI
eukprot:TRINITY_DN34852_c0_g1_i1.p1 TRINITY_DN34852_c0_g1~~TRINITY_DN34852_c0_g1_i1.p1  ORF type:complete len:413 (-),score=53.91 TRINITY_DN34852_c0_g1_i1:165-1403(-)